MARILLFFGGQSAEHEVSCVSAVAAVEALESKGHTLVPVGIAKDGGWHLADTGELPFTAAGPEVVLEVPEGRLIGPDGPIAVDVAFPVLHGPYGEDGTIQGMFEMAGLPYVGAGVLGSAAAMDKDFAKRLFREAGLPVAEAEITTRAAVDTDRDAAIAALGETLGYPVFVKPANMGSSVGITCAGNAAELAEALDLALEYDSKVVVEVPVPGREIEVAVLEGPRASVPGEIIVADGWYTYDAKYADEATRLEIPAALSAEATAEVQDLACRAFTAVGGAGLARVDFFYDEGGSGFVLNEVNTMPGFTPKSMFPMMWDATGLPYPDLCDELVRLALAR
jgi:D-alanine-D-alanine ligase